MSTLYLCSLMFFRGHWSRALMDALTEMHLSGLNVEPTSSQKPSLLSSLTLKVGTGVCPMDSLPKQSSQPCFLAKRWSLVHKYTWGMKQGHAHSHSSPKDFPKLTPVQTALVSPLVEVLFLWSTYRSVLSGTVVLTICLFSETHSKNNLSDAAQLPLLNVSSFSWKQLMRKGC